MQFKNELELAEQSVRNDTDNQIYESVLVQGKGKSNNSNKKMSKSERNRNKKLQRAEKLN